MQEDQVKITKMSTKGQIVIPKGVRSTHHWQPGQKLILIETEDGVVLKAAPPFKTSTIDDVAGSLKYSGKPKSIEEMNEGIAKAARERHNIQNKKPS